MWGVYSLLWDTVYIVCLCVCMVNVSPKPSSNGVMSIQFSVATDNDVFCDEAYKLP